MYVCIYVCNIPGNNTAVVVLPDSASINLAMPLATNKLSLGNSFEKPTYPGSIRIPAAPLGSIGHRYIEDAPTSYFDLVVTSSRSQWP